MNIPQQITIKEWKEIMELPEIRKEWELENTDTLESFIKNAYGVKFNYTNEIAQELGDFYIISSGDYDGYNSMIKRTSGTLFVQS